MTLYAFVPGKAGLLDLILDSVYLRVPRGTRPDAPWRGRVEAVVRENRGLCGHHPWVAALSAARPPLGPGLMTKHEHELAAFEGSALDTQAAVRDSALSDRQWWAAHEPLLAKVFDPARFPLAARVGRAAGEAHQGMYDPEHAFTFGLRRILDGLARLGEPG
ncbi:MULTISPECIES: TetR/AcrR family transcriptional regulator C-terminal domain-containing protein [unclassified Streptomyces]|uniref:TetR/AcrR family transcriptional regulator C-terminal domain-containing protein n=1 Tax=unclassified Streptomyces TaxID=2593676 RepID=UPI000DC4F126|nr:TetR/AcrR family transcriptional regulator C-terminal domain-containing protein [Streptomyces sp. PsTaAH-130]RAJ54237.1 tetracycline repressor-like protein [Streptomyces sp. PsTaAH-130]